MQVKELRIILTVENLEEVINFYSKVASMPTSKEWDGGIILEAGKASLELIDQKHAARIDDMEVGKRVAGPVRLALNIGENNIEQAAAECLEAGATQIAPIAQAPWSKVMRLQDPSGMQFTLFETSTLFSQE
jgi:predicted enzyme related to lactoylglutathione lyase